MATLDGLLGQIPKSAHRFTDAEQALRFIEGKKGWRQGREVEYKGEDGKARLTRIRLTRPGFRPIDVVVLEFPDAKGKEEKAA